MRRTPAGTLTPSTRSATRTSRAANTELVSTAPLPKPEIDGLARSCVQSSVPPRVPRVSTPCEYPSRRGACCLPRALECRMCARRAAPQNEFSTGTHGVLNGHARPHMRGLRPSDPVTDPARRTPGTQAVLTRCSRGAHAVLTPGQACGPGGVGAGGVGRLRHRRRAARRGQVHGQVLPDVARRLAVGE